MPPSSGGAMKDLRVDSWIEMIKKIDPEHEEIWEEVGEIAKTTDEGFTDKEITDIRNSIVWSDDQ